MEILTAFLLVTVCGAVCYSILRPQALFVVRLSRRGVTFRGKFPAAKRPEVEEFLTREFANYGRITVSGVKAGPRGVRFIVRGNVTDGDRQRIRNFFQVIG